MKDILGKEITRDAAVTGDVKDCFEKKGILKHSKEAKTEEERCLTCNKVCENCVDVCPNVQYFHQGSWNGYESGHPRRLYV